MTKKTCYYPGFPFPQDAKYTQMVKSSNSCERLVGGSVATVHVYQVKIQ